MADTDKAKLIERLRSLAAMVNELINDIEAAPAGGDVKSEAVSDSATKTAAIGEPPATARRKIAWGAKVSPVFRERIWWIADQLALDPDDLMSCIAWESGETFRPDIKNQAGSGATGLIQFMPSTAKALGTSTASLAAMTAEDQLNYVYRYFEPWKGRLKTLSDIYMAILWPKGVGKAESYVLFDRDLTPTAYRQNSGIDINRDGKVTKAEAAAKVLAKKQKGMQPEYMA